MHTNTIECEWSLIRPFLAKFRGIRPEDLQTYLDEYAFRKNMGKTDCGLWRKFLLVVAMKQHIVSKPKFNK